MSTLSWFVAIPAGHFATLGTQGAHNYEGVRSNAGLWIRSATADRELHLHTVTSVPEELVTEPYLYTAGSPYGPLLVFRPWTMAVLEHCAAERPDYLGPARELLPVRPRSANIRAPRRAVIV